MLGVTMGLAFGNLPALLVIGGAVDGSDGVHVQGRSCCCRSALPLLAVLLALAASRASRVIKAQVSMATVGCPRCGAQLQVSNVKGVPYQCPTCNMQFVL